MAHAHSHGHDERAYYLDQLFTIAVCGSLGLVAVLMYRWNWLGILADPFHLPVLLGGVALLIVVAVRAVALWQAVGSKAAREHHHDHHHHDHAHDHHHHDHAHGHDHHHDHAHEHHHHH